MIPGEVQPAMGPSDGDVVPVGGDTEVWLDVVNRGDRPVQVGSHYHLFEANPRLDFDRAAAYGRRLAIPAGSSIRFEPGERRRVPTVPLRGARIVRGFHGLVDGPLDDGAVRRAAVQRARERGFSGIDR